jgi:hypothetical protein
MRRQRKPMQHWGSWVDGNTAEGVLNRYRNTPDLPAVVIITPNDHGSAAGADPFHPGRTEPVPDLAEHPRAQAVRHRGPVPARPSHPPGDRRRRPRHVPAAVAWHARALRDPSRRAGAQSRHPAAAALEVTGGTGHLTQAPTTGLNTMSPAAVTRSRR